MEDCEVILFCPMKQIDSKVVNKKVCSSLSKDDEGAVFEIWRIERGTVMMEEWDIDKEREVYCESGVFVRVWLKSKAPVEGKWRFVNLYYPYSSGVVSATSKEGAFLNAFLLELGEEARDPENWEGCLVRIVKWSDGEHIVRLLWTEQRIKHEVKE